MDEALVKKLRIPQTGKVAVFAPPAGFLELIGRPDGVVGLDDVVGLGGVAGLDGGVGANAVAAKLDSGAGADAIGNLGANGPDAAAGQGANVLDKAAGPDANVQELPGFDYVQLFATDVAELDRLAPAALRAVKPDGLLWCCYPKGTAKIKTDLNRDRGWDIVTAAGWEGIAIVSIDDTWSALRFRPLAVVGKSRIPPAERRKQAAALAAAPGATAASAAGPLEVPEDLRRALDASPQAAAFFDRLAPSHKKEYIQWIVEAKREDTRLSRIGKTVAKLSEGLKRPSDK